MNTDAHKFNAQDILIKSADGSENILPKLSESSPKKYENFLPHPDLANNHKHHFDLGKAVHETEREVKEYWHILGPGFTTGASDDDPSGIATYSQTGAMYGFQLIWMSLFTFPLMAVVQEMCARIGLVTGRGLAANIRQFYSETTLYICTILLLAANIFNIGANLGAMAEAVRLLWSSADFGLLVVAFGLGSLLLEIFVSYERYAKYLKYLALVLLAYVISALSISIDWLDVFHRTLVPSMIFDKETIVMMCAILGTTISPYLFFWQTSQEVEEKILHNELPNNVPTPRDMRNMHADVWTGMFISNLVMFFIIAACAAALHATGLTDIKTAADAAIALRPFAGDFAFVLFAVGIIGTGMLAIPVLAGSAAYAVSESFGWRFGLYRKLKEAYAFYGVIAAAIIVGMVLNFVGLDPIKALIYSAVGNGLVAPVILFLIVAMSSREDIMGNLKNGRLGRSVGWLTVVLMSLAAIGTLWALLG